jgi:hypothetical protein
MAKEKSMAKNITIFYSTLSPPFTVILNQPEYRPKKGSIKPNKRYTKPTTTSIFKNIS